jgi:hypothetical protein
VFLITLVLPCDLVQGRCQSEPESTRVRKRCGPELAARFDSHTFHAFAKRIIGLLTGQDALDPDYAVGPRRVQRRSIAFNDMVRAKHRLVLTVCESRERPDGAGRCDMARTEHDEFVGYVTPYL